MNLLRAVVMSEGIAIRIGILIWDLRNCRGNVSLISYQLYLLILHFRGAVFLNLLPQSKFYWNKDEGKNKII